MKKKKVLKISLILIICIIVAGVAAVFGINAYVKFVGGKNIISVEDAKKLEGIDCIVVLGCGVDVNGKPSWMLKDRLKMGIDLYNQDISGKIIMSGDHGKKYYDEVNVMKQFAIDSKIPSNDIFMDHAGFSTYESMYRAKEIFEADSVVIVSQKYHLYRAIYIAEKLGIKAYGVNSDYNNIYGGEKYREIREILARFKDFFKTVFKSEPTYLGDVIPVSGDGNITND